MSIDVAVLVVLVLVCLANLALVALLVWPRRSPRQSVGGAQRAGEPVPPGARQSVPAAAGAAMNAEDELKWERDQRNQVMARLIREFPTLGAGKRKAAADEIIAKARRALARIP